MDEENSIILNDLETEQLQNLIATINQGTNDTITTVITPITEEILRIARNIGWINEEVNLSNIGLTQTEINRFNAKFEFVGAQNVESKEVVNIINSIKDNIIDVETSSEKQFRLKLDRSNSNQEKVNIITQYLTDEKSKKYNIKVEFNQENGLAEYVVLNRVED